MDDYSYTPLIIQNQTLTPYSNIPLPQVPQNSRKSLLPLLSETCFAVVPFVSLNASLGNLVVIPNADPVHLCLKHMHVYQISHTEQGRRVLPIVESNLYVPCNSHNSILTSLPRPESRERVHIEFLYSSMNLCTTLLCQAVFVESGHNRN